MVDKIGQISFAVNNWELVSANSAVITSTPDEPPVRWFTDLSREEKAVKWRGVFLRPNGEMAKSLGGKVDNFVVEWALDFSIIHPRKLPEPQIESLNGVLCSLLFRVLCTQDSTKQRDGLRRLFPKRRFDSEFID